MRSDIALAAASMSCVASFTIVVLVVVEHRFTLRPTSLLSLYILMSLLLDVVKSRSYFLRHWMSALGGLSAAAAAAKAILIAVQEIPKTALLIDENLRHTTSKEATSGFWNRSVFAWLNSIFLVGFRQTLCLEDLEPLDPPLSAGPLLNRFIPKWDKGAIIEPEPLLLEFANFRLQGRSNSLRGSLAFACFATLWWPFCAVIIPRLLYSGLTFAQPFLLQRILDCVTTENPPAYERIGLIVASGLVFGARGVFGVIVISLKNGAAISSQPKVSQYSASAFTYLIEKATSIRVFGLKDQVLIEGVIKEQRNDQLVFVIKRKEILINLSEISRVAIIPE